MVADPKVSETRNAGTASAALIVTTVSRSASAAITEASFRNHHVGTPVHVVVVDDRFDEVCRNRTAWRRLRTLDLGTGADDRELLRLVMSHEARALSHIVGPSAAGALIDELALDRLIVLPDDAQVQRPVDLSAYDEPGLHAFQVRETDPPHDGRLPDQRDELSAGTVDQDCFVVSGRAGRKALTDWAEKLARNPLENTDHFDVTVANWLDVLALRRSDVSVHPRVIGSYRNLDELSVSDATILRFPSFDPHRPWVLSERAGEWPRVLLSTASTFTDIVRTRTRQLLGTVFNGIREPYSALPNGHRIDSVMRSLYQSALVFSERESKPEPPNPFAAGESDAFTEWLAEPVEGSLSRYLVGLRRARPDIAARFGSDSGAYLVWSQRDAAGVGVWVPRGVGDGAAPHGGAHQGASRHGAAHHEHPGGAEVALSPVFRTEIRESREEHAGINVVGLLSAQLGVGETARLTLQSIANAKVQFSIVDHDATVSKRDQSLLASVGDRPTGFPFDVDLLMVNADLTAETLAAFRRPGKAQRPTIGMWAWEVQQFPQRMYPAFDSVDEVWVHSDFARDALAAPAAEYGVTVHTFPLRMRVPKPMADRAAAADALHSLGVPHGNPTFVFAFDYFSVAERKQPWAVVEAFRRAFPTETAGGPRLIVKSINQEFFPVDRERLLYARGTRTDVLVVEGYLPAVQRDALIAGATAYVSLHRAEGYGLTLAEAMSVGTPTIATGWSGNLQFMTPENSFLVPADLVAISPETPVYAGLGEWAEPDIAIAANLMQRILDEPDEAQRRAEQAQRDIVRHNEAGEDVAFVLNRLRLVRQRSGPQFGYLPPKPEPDRVHQSQYSHQYSQPKVGGR
jgi:hypothetical protein